MAEFILEANERQVDKQSQLSEIRDNSRVPGVVYGFSQKPLSIDVAYKELLDILNEAGTSNIITLKIGGKDFKVIVREYQQHPVTDKLTHVDFMAIDEKRELTTVVPLEFVGTSKAVREQGGMLNVKNDQVNVRCLPQNLPAKIEVDVALLAEMGQKLVISDLQVDEKVTILNNPNDPVITVIVPKKIKLAAPTSTEEGGEEGTEGAEGEAKEGAEGEAKEGADKPAEEKKA